MSDLPFSEQFKDALERCGLPMMQVGKRLDIPYRTLQDWKSGARKPKPYAQKSILESIIALSENNE